LLVNIFLDNTQAIGRTPLVQLARVVPTGAMILAQIEGRNPAFSVKCRLGAVLVWNAEQRDVLRAGMEII
jgi:cysteine synthase